MGTIRVLVVDDEEKIRRATIEHLSRFDDLEVIGEASTGVEAIEKFNSFIPDVVLLDVSMPIMNGFQTTEALLSNNPKARIIILTAMLTAQHLKACHSAGALDCISKENLYLELVPAIRKGHLTRRPG